jgi:hypothetical protein
MKKHLAFIALIIMLAQLTHATTYYVSNSGNDNYSGTSTSSPWQTCGKATSTVSAGDTVYFMGGTYFESHTSSDGNTCTLYITRGGATNDPVVYKAYPGMPRPIFRGQFIDGNGDRGGRAIYVRGCSNVVLDSLIATNSYHHGIKIGLASYVIVKNCVAYYCGNRFNDNSAGIGVLYDPSNNITVQSCSTYAIYNYPISSEGGDVNTHGICVYRCRNCTFDDNVVHDIGGLGVGIRLKWLDTLCVVSNNTVYNCYDGILLGPESDMNSAYGNLVYNISGGGGIVIKAGNNTGPNDHSDVYNNTLYNCTGAGIGLLPYNTIYNASIWNNLIVNSHGPGGFYNLTAEANNHPNLYSNYNCYYNTSTNTVAYWHGANYTLSQLRSSTGLDQNSINSDPVFANAAAHDFSLTPSSPAVLRTGGRPGYLSYIGAIDPNEEPVVDTIPPVISNVSAGNITSSSASITWTTNEPASSQVNYGLSTSYGQSTTANRSLVDSHIAQLTGLQANTVYHYRVRSIDGYTNQRISGDYTFRTDTVSSLENVAPGSGIVVSGTYSGYSANVINDGSINGRQNSATWASDESSSPHWIEFDFTENKRVSQIKIYWAYNNYQSQWMCSQQYRIQYWDAEQNDFVDLTTVNNSTSDSVTTTVLQPVITSRIRYYQPANMGPAIYQSIVWLTEIQILGAGVDDDTPPGRIMDLNAIPGESDGVIELSWTAPGDDGDVGVADHYEIRYSLNLITESNWEEATELVTPPTPASPGTQQLYEVSSLIAGEAYYFGITTYDVAGWESQLSNIVESFAGGVLIPIPLATEIDSTHNSATVTAQVTESYYSLYYVFELDSAETFPEPELNLDLAADTVASVTFSNLSNEIIYYWRVCAVTSNGVDTSDWSTTIQFNLITGVTAALASTDCVFPFEGATIFESQPYLEVNSLPNLQVYYFQVDDQIDFSSPIASGPVPKASGTTTQWQVSEPLTTGQTYYWRVSSDGVVYTAPLSFAAVLDIHPFPNPYRPSEGHNYITFTNLVENSDIVIATISGDIVFQEDNIGPTDWVWNVKNDGGKDLAPGVYLFNINFPSGSVSGKVMVIR